MAWYRMPDDLAYRLHKSSRGATRRIFLLVMMGLYDLDTERSTKHNCEVYTSQGESKRGSKLFLYQYHIDLARRGPTWLISGTT